MLIKKKWMVRVLVLVVLGSVVLAGKKIFSPPQAINSALGAHGRAQESVLEFLPTDLAEVIPRRLEQRLVLLGTLHPANQVLIKAKVSGDVRDILVREGSVVKAGQVLVRVDDREYLARVKQAEGALAAARGQLIIATKNKDNNQVLVEKGFVSKNAFDQVDSQFVIASANVASAQATLDIARKILSDTVLVAPIAGWVSRRSVELGEKVSSDNTLLHIVDLGQMELEAAVPATDIANIHVGQEVRMNVEGVGQPVFGRVVRLNPEVQSGSRSFLIYVRIDNPSGTLRSGMFGEMQLVLSQKEAVLSIPESAVQKEMGIPYVFAVEGQRLVKKTVTLGMVGQENQHSMIEVLSGLTKGAQVVRSNLGTLRSNALIKIQTTSVIPTKG